MAFSLAKTCIHFAFIFSALAITINTVNGDESFAETLSLDDLRLQLKPEQLTHLHFYFHDALFVPKPTSVIVAQAATTNQSATFFGMVGVLDDPLTRGPNLTSELLGRAQGINAFASQEEQSFLVAMNFVLTKGKYKGSSITILGRRTISDKVTELPIVGGTGAFRFARGYALARTVSMDFQTASATVEYDLYVLHH